MMIDDVTVLDRGKENLEYSDLPPLEKKCSYTARSCNTHYFNEKSQ
jgi:hypothetical protein